MVYLNAEPLAWEPGLTLAELLRRAGRDPALAAVTADGRFVPRPEYGAFLVPDGCGLRVFELHDGG